MPRYCRVIAVLLPRYCRVIAALLPRYCRVIAALLPQEGITKVQEGAKRSHILIIEKKRSENKLSNYIKQAWKIVEPKTQYTHGWHIDAICEHLEAVTAGQIRNLIINIPPRHMKSRSVCVFWPTWSWIFSPETCWLFASYAEKLAIRDAVASRRLMQSKWYQDRWKDSFSFTGDQNQKSRYDNDQGGHRLAVGVTGGAIGDGGDILVVDDPLKPKDAYSETVRLSTNTWWRETMATRGNDPRTVAKVMIMQRLHEHDLTGDTLARMEQGGEKYELLCLPAEYEPHRKCVTVIWSDPRQQEGDLLWAERFRRQEIETLKSVLGSYGAAGQLQQRPAPISGGIIKEKWLRFWVPDGVDLPPHRIKVPDGEHLVWYECPQVTLPKRFKRQSQSWDMAFKNKKTSSYVVGQVWGELGADHFLLDQTREKLDLPGTIEAVENLSEKWPRAVRKLVEDKANGPGVIASLKNKLHGLVAVSPEGDKIARTHAVSPILESGNVYLPHPAIAPWISDWIKEVTTFPGSAYSDQLDGLTQYLSEVIRLLEANAKRKKKGRVRRIVRPIVNDSW